MHDLKNNNEQKTNNDTGKQLLTVILTVTFARASISVTYIYIYMCNNN